MISLASIQSFGNASPVQYPVSKMAVTGYAALKRNGKQSLFITKEYNMQRLD